MMMIKKLLTKCFLKARRIRYSLFSNNINVIGTFSAHQPVVLRGKGLISFNENVNFGVINAPKFYNSYAYIEARSESAKISFGNNVHVNNAFSIISEKEITISDNVLIGYNCQIFDSNFHDLQIDNRQHTDPEPQVVIIQENVFIGNNVVILKGVSIGKNTVVASNSVVTKSFPENVVIGGNPAKVINEL